MRQIYDLYGGRGSVDGVISAAETGSPTAAELNDRLFYAHLYAGLYLDVAGDPGTARYHLARAVENFQISYYMWDVGRIHLEGLSDTPASSAAASSEAPTSDKTQARKQKSFRDPSPPKIRPPSGKAHPEPRRHPAVAFHSEPKPLQPDAISHDWTSFLGQTSNAVSSETKLLTEFPESGPPLVWEMEKGTSYASPAVSGERLVYIHRVGD